MIKPKATIICIYEILKKYSDQDHKISVNRIIEKLEALYSITMDRRAVYRNIEALQSIGIQVESYSENGEGYYLLSRDFDASDIRLLCDAVAASGMIQDEQSRNLINKLISSLSVFEGRMLHRTQYVKTPVKRDPSVFTCIDALNAAVSNGCKVSAELFELDYDLNPVENANKLIFSPYVTFWADGKYYVLAKNDNSDDLTHYRIDRLRKIELLEQGVDMVFGGINATQYAEKYILNHNEIRARAIIQCNKNVWPDITEQFDDLAVISITGDVMRVQVRDIPSRILDFVLCNLDNYELLEPRNLRDKVRSSLMVASRKYI